jgi:hypothetical protein
VRHRRLGVAITAVIGCGALALPVGEAGAATQIGETFEPTGNCSPRTRLQSGFPGGQYAAPFAGVITSWSFQSSDAGGASPVKFKVGRNAGGDDFTIVGESEFKNIPDLDLLNTFTARIPVLAGDVIGLYAAPPSVFLCTRAATGYVVHQSAFGEEVVVGATATFAPVNDQQLGVSATLEPDCDTDGFGDETQDPDTSLCKDRNFSFGKLKRNKKKGTATLTVVVPGPGTLVLGGKGLVRQRRGAASRAASALAKAVSAAGQVKLKVKPKGTKRRTLDGSGTVTVKAKVTYTPSGGVPNTKPRRIKLVKRL